MEEADHCPICKGTKIRRGSNLFKHYWRVLSGSQLRYCRECGERWHIYGPPNTVRRLIFNRYFLLLAAAAFVGIKLVTFSLPGESTSLDPLRPVKYFLALTYEKVFGEQAPQKLWRHWDSVFESEQEALQSVKELSIETVHDAPRRNRRPAPAN